MIFEQIECGGDRNFAYLIGDEDSRQAALVDPAYGVEAILAQVNKLGLTVMFVLNTHAHYDHSGGNSLVVSETGAKVVAHESAGIGDVAVKDGETLSLGALELKIIHTPGHTEDSICILAQGKLCAGDTLFVGKVGGTDYGQGARNEYDSIHNKLMVLDDSTEVYPGHDYGIKPRSTIGYEKKNNPFILQPGFKEFIDLKKNWLTYKKEHSIP